MEAYLGTGSAEGPEQGEAKPRQTGIEAAKAKKGLKTQQEKTL